MKKMRRSTKLVITGVLASAVVSISAIGFSLAYLTDTDQKINNLAFVDQNADKSLKGEVDEPLWSDPGNPDSTDPGLGKNIAQNLLPGTTVPKNPFIKNISTADVSEYAAIKITYEGIMYPVGVDGKIDTSAPVTSVLTDAQVADLVKILQFGRHSDPADSGSPIVSGLNLGAGKDSWTQDANTPSTQNGVIYFYNDDNGIARDGQTASIFDSFKIDPNADNDDLAAIAGFANGGVNIKVDGAVCQKENLDFSLNPANEGTSAYVLDGLLQTGGAS